jgi:hypothetical protein
MPRIHRSTKISQIFRVAFVEHWLADFKDNYLREMFTQGESYVIPDVPEADLLT